MREQIKRILGLVKDGRLSHDDAITLLAALNPKLAQKDSTLLRLFSLLSDDAFGPDQVTGLLLGMIGEVPAPPAPPRPAATFKVGGQGFPQGDLGDAIASRVEEALGGLLGRGSRTPRPGTILKIETEDENGGSFSANLPLSLASHAERLIPPHAQKALERSGLSIDAIKLLLQAGPPPGKLLEAEDENGNSVKLSIQ